MLTATVLEDPPMFTDDPCTPQMIKSLPVSAKILNTRLLLPAKIPQLLVLLGLVTIAGDLVVHGQRLLGEHGCEAHDICAV
jgi:hypothetical protein